MAETVFNGIRLPKDMFAGRQHEIPADRGSAPWRRRGNNGRFVATRPGEKAKTPVSGRFRLTDDVDFRTADVWEVS